MSQVVMNELVNMSQEIIRLKDEKYELLAALKKAHRLGLTFSIGNAYISRAFIDAQDELTAQINALITKAEATK